MPVYTSCPYNTKTWRQTCPANTTSFTDTIVADSTDFRTVHINELRTSVNQEKQRRNRGVADDISFTDPTLTALVTDVRVIHITDLRSAMTNLDAMSCPSDTNSGPPSWTDSTITANVTNYRKPHIDQLRTYINQLRVTCVCNCEFCNYCSDCGNMSSCGCDDHLSTECSFACGARNSGISTENPPTNWCVYDYGNNWNYLSYGCMCTPYLWGC